MKLKPILLFIILSESTLTHKKDTKLRALSPQLTSVPTPRQAPHPRLSTSPDFSPTFSLFSLLPLLPELSFQCPLAAASISLKLHSIRPLLSPTDLSYFLLFPKFCFHCTSPVFEGVDCSRSSLLLAGYL